nr:MAG TPA: hypothetical protein [Caudoviricetes sp.]
MKPKRINKYVGNSGIRILCMFRGLGHSSLIRPSI